MKLTTLYKNPTNSEAFVFVSGFGFLPNAFSMLRMPHGADSFFLFDYTDFSNTAEIQQILRCYKSLSIVAYSMGVCVAHRIFSTLNVKSATAINGTIFGIHQHFGIAPKIFALTKRNFNREQFLQVCFESTQTPNLEILSPIDTLKNELDSLESFCKEKNTSIMKWDKVIISRTDRIFPLKTQNAAWDMYKESYKNLQILYTDAPHFVFDNKALWEEQCLHKDS